MLNNDVQFSLILDRLKPFLTDFSTATGCAVTLMDPDSQKIRFNAGGKDCLQKFHCTTPHSAGNCSQILKDLAEKSYSTADFSVYHCNKNLLSAYVPLIVKKQHTLDLIVGQVLPVPVGAETFTRLAQINDYPQPEYTHTLAEFPVINQKIFTATVRFLAASVALAVIVEAPQDSLYPALNQLARKLTSYGQIFELAEDAVILCSNDGQIEDFNKKTTEICGYNQSELYGLNIASCFSAQELNSEPFDFDQLKRTGETRHQRNLMTKDGTVIPIDMWCRLLPHGGFWVSARDLSEQKKSQKKLETKQAELEQEQALLKDMSSALKILIKEADREKKDFKKKLAENTLSLVNPYVEQLKKTNLDSRQKKYLSIIESSLDNIIAPSLKTSFALKMKLSTAELRIATLVKQGRTSKEIAEILFLSSETIDKHRANIRKKLGVTNQKISLKTLLEDQDEH